MFGSRRANLSPTGELEMARASGRKPGNCRDPSEDRRTDLSRGDESAMVTIVIFAGLVVTGAIFATLKNFGKGSESKFTQLNID
jgi:hypothetical protein